jgi:hypothetical protein
VGGLAVEALLLERMAEASGLILDSLLAALESKSKAAFKSRALAALHQMNNWAHVLHACDTAHELKAVGEGWADRHKVRQS